MSLRRTNAIRGFVNFPVESEEFKSTGEGGMFVRLVVVPEYDNHPDEIACCGGRNHILCDETLITGDKDRNIETHPCYSEYHLQHYPRINKGHSVENELSIGYYAVITLGSTGWSGFSDKKEFYWECTFEDLTEEGKAIYRSMQALFPHSDVELQTWLDT